MFSSVFCIVKSSTVFRSIPSTRTRALSPGVATPAPIKEARARRVRERANSVVVCCSRKTNRPLCSFLPPSPSYDYTILPHPSWKDNQYVVWVSEGRKTGKKRWRTIVLTYYYKANRDEPLIDILLANNGTQGNWFVI